MKLTGKWPAWKIWIAASIGVLVLADVVLGLVLWQMARQAPADMAARRNQLLNTAAQLERDNAHGEQIRAQLAQAGKESSDFYADSFMDSKTVYGTIDSDVGAIASKAGVKIMASSNHATAVPDWNLSELDIGMTVEGQYPALLEFISGIERSKNFYFLNELQLNSAGPNGIRLQLDLHTYFRT